MIPETGIDIFLENRQQFPVVLDVRSPSEFEQGHIPGAVSFPLFTNEERALVGTLYKQKGKNIAIEKGLEIAGNKLSFFVKKAREISEEKPVLLYCWRGGMRSQSMAWLLNMCGIKTYRLTGGYKSFRKRVLNGFFIKQPVYILGGKTGSGKTQILKELQLAGESVLDIEEIASHKGSAFGSLNQSGQPSQEQFENTLFIEILKLHPNKPIWIEDESRLIGKKVIPLALWEKMRASPVYFLDITDEQRVKNLLEDYGGNDIHQLKSCFEQIAKRLGPEQFKESLLALSENNLEKACKIALTYYDKSYLHGLSKRDANTIIHIKPTYTGCKFIAKQLLEIKNNKKHEP